MFLNAHSKRSRPKYVEIVCCKASDNEAIKSLDISRFGKRLLVGTSTGDALLFSTEELRMIRQDLSCSKLSTHVLHRLDDHDGAISCCSFAKNGSSFITGAWDGCIRVWRYNLDALSWQSICLPCHDRAEHQQRLKVTACCFNSSDSAILASCVDEEQPRLFVILRIVNCIDLVRFQGLPQDRAATHSYIRNICTPQPPP